VIYFYLFFLVCSVFGPMSLQTNVVSQNTPKKEHFFDILREHLWRTCCICLFICKKTNMYNKIILDAQALSRPFSFFFSPSSSLLLLSFFFSSLFSSLFFLLAFSFVLSFRSFFSFIAPDFSFILCQALERSGLALFKPSCCSQHCLVLRFPRIRIGDE